MRNLDAPVDCWTILSNDALSEDAAANRNRYLARQASRRWLAHIQVDARIEWNRGQA